MFGIHDFGVFIVTGILLNLAPGPDTFYILGRSMAQGRGSSIASALGLSAIIASSATVFLVVKLTGAIYLVYLGARMLLRRNSSSLIPTIFSSSGFLAVFRQGLFTNLLNPKVALFFLAFMSQFISEDSTTKFAAFVTLGLCFVITGTIWCMDIAWFASLLGNFLRGRPSFSMAINSSTFCLFRVSAYSSQMKKTSFLLIH